MEEQKQQELWSKDTYGSPVSSQPDPSEFDTYGDKKKKFKELKEPEPTMKFTKKEVKATANKVATKKRHWGSDTESDRE